MPARRSEDPSLGEAEKRGDGAREHWDPATRAAARPAPLQRSLPDRDNRAEGAADGEGGAADDSALACEDDEGRPEASGGREATEE